MRFNDSVAIVTGGGRGIGRAVAQRLAADGAAVACLDIVEAAAQETADLITAAGGRALAVVADVAERATVERAVARTVEEYGRVTHLANVAGTNNPAGDFDSLTDAEWDALMAINLRGSFTVSQVVARAIAEAGGGAIVLISSVDGVVSVSGLPHYAASKAGVAMLAKDMAVSLADRGIRVNAVAPGPVATPLLSAYLEQNTVLRDMIKHRTLLSRLAEPAEIAAAVAFLLSDDASFVTGFNMHVDGGWSAR